MSAAVNSNIVTLIIITGLFGLLPFLVVITTSFTKVSIVLFLVRNALGIQQTPPNMVLYAIAIVISAYVMAPVMTQTYTILTDPRSNYQSVSDIEHTATRAMEPTRAFLDRYASQESREFFVESSEKIWAGANIPHVGPMDMVVLMPAFLISELKRAFEIGFLLYLPFLMIDFIASITLMALGMSMMSPAIVSTPFKILLFVWADGWNRLIHGLIMSYALGG